MALKELSIGLGILAGSAGVTNSGYGLYQNFVVEPSRNAEYNMALMTETPLLVESVEIQPVSDLAMRVEVTVKIFKTGDILVESGNRRQYIPFRLASDAVAQNSLIRAAFAAETQLIDGVEYEVKILRYLETVKPLADNKMQRVRTYADGNVETSIIDMRSNKVLETNTVHKELTETERKAIEASPYKKKTFVPLQ
ncbi:MAG: hypothetical protein PVF75_04100 [Granulosicoccaceae bacterium]|jgi:hypothetical protein